MFSRRKGNLIDSLRTVSPLVLGMGAQAVNEFVDRAFLAQYSDSAIQASLPGGMLSWLFICLLVMTVGYTGTFVAQFFGAGSKKDAASAYGQGLWLALASLPLILATIPLGNWILDLCGHAPGVLRDEKTYYDILQLGGMFCVFGAVMSSYYTGLGRTRLVGMVTVVGSATNILLDWMFVFGHWGCGRWGIAGAGWATVLAAIVPCLVFGGMTLFDPVLAGRRYWVALRPRPVLMKRIVRYGLPSGVHHFLDAGTFTVFVMVTGKLDALSFAVSNICFTINSLSFAAMIGLSQGASVLVGQYQGAHDSASAVRATRSCVFLGTAYVGLFAVTLLCLPHAILNLFRSDTTQFNPVEFYALGKNLMMLLLSWSLFDVMSLVVGGALQGAGDTRFVMLARLVSSMGFWMPAVFLILWLKPSIICLWSTLPFYCGICAAACLVRFARGRWKSFRLVDDLVGGEA